jgi:hypothetical protein
MTSEFLSSIEKIEKSILEVSKNLKLAWEELKVLKELTAYPIQPKPQPIDYFKNMKFNSRDAIMKIKSHFGVDPIEIDRFNIFVTDVIYEYRISHFSTILSLLENRGFLEIKRSGNKNAHIASFKFKNV